MTLYRYLLAPFLLLSTSRQSSLAKYVRLTTSCAYPALINATADQLQQGLVEGCFTSVDLLNVLHTYKT